MHTIELPSQEDWALLGIGPETSYSDAKRAYRRAARSTHPDGASGNAERFRQVTGAWERISASLKWRDAHGASSESFEEAEEEFDEEETPLDPDVADWSPPATADVVTASLFERFVRKLGRGVFLAGRFPERDYSAFIALTIATFLAYFVRSCVHPAGLASSLAGLIVMVVVGRIVATPTRISL